MPTSSTTQSSCFGCRFVSPAPRWSSLRHDPCAGQSCVGWIYDCTLESCDRLSVGRHEEEEEKDHNPTNFRASPGRCVGSFILSLGVTNGTHRFQTSK